MLNKSNAFEKGNNSTSQSLNKGVNNTHSNTKKSTQLRDKLREKEELEERKHQQSNSNMVSHKDIKHGSLQVIINRLRMFYFFSEERLGIIKFINTVKTLKMTLHCEDETLLSNPNLNPNNNNANMSTQDREQQNTFKRNSSQLGDIEFDISDF